MARQHIPRLNLDRIASLGPRTYLFPGLDDLAWLLLDLEQACPPPFGGSGAGKNLKYLGICGEMGL
jgi:hypothetical protein